MTEYTVVKVPKCPVCKKREWREVEQWTKPSGKGRGKKMVVVAIVMECVVCGQRRMEWS